MPISPRRMRVEDIDGLFTAFAAWNKTPAQFSRYWDECERGARVTLVVEINGEIVGYGNLLWQSVHAPFRAAAIPEISDVLVTTDHEGQGIGTRIIGDLEAVARERHVAVIGIGVGLGPDAARARRLYAHLGYTSDGAEVHRSPDGDEIFLKKSLVLTRRPA